TLDPLENEDVIQAFLTNHPQWEIESPPETFPAPSLVSPSGGLKVIPTEHNTDGFFMVRLTRRSNSSS
ncbi:16S rRNA (cytosine(967)-C(5))-methyltransferase, partial [Bacillus sp. SIMBA_161]